ncbi:glutathione S-transferase [Pseudomonas sp. FW300-N1A1]|uniref:glutathione S-transferase N-terminal domain-containing protein n=1 Tax=Pseudomonas sp. FW300-N1A1 TaxID=2075555 RepID=UPI000CD0CAD4|nr:glutathione S-transferase [Pseudomonas sp. FW300-N1A1]POA18268.1 glutathione S-transferase [Pseudomonas sp. FW300-N1A1]
MYRLFGATGSGSAVIEMALERCNVPYSLVQACSWEPGVAREALKRVNPLMQVPTLVLPDGSVITESVAILIHLGLGFPASGLLPQNDVLKAQALRGLVYIATNCYVPIGIIDYPERWLSERDERSMQCLREGARSQLYKNWDTFSDQFSGKAVWCRDDPGALEMLAAVVSRWAQAREYLKISRPGFHASLECIDLHPHVRSVLERHWPIDPS